MVKSQIHLPEIRPDEFSRGYQGRLRAPNPETTKAKFLNVLRDETNLNRTPIDKSTTVSLLASVTGLPVGQFVRGHSLLPFHRVVSTDDVIRDHGDPAYSTLLEKFGTKTCKKEDARYCVHCIAEDLDYWSFAYWRRSHQLPGVTCCSKHGTQLTNSSLGNAAFDRMPSQSMYGKQDFSEQDFQKVLANPTLNRYTDIANAFLEAARPKSHLLARYLVSDRLMECQLRICKEGIQPTLTDKVLEAVPMEWMKVNFPAIGNRKPGEFFHPIDNITIGIVSSQVYALALAVLFDSSDDALNYWLGDKGKGSLQPDAKVDSSNLKEMFELYVEHKGNHKTIIESLDSSSKEVSERLIASGLPSLELVNLETTARAVLDFHKGMSIKQTCKTHGISQVEFEGLLSGGISMLCSALETMSHPVQKTAKSSKVKNSN